MKKKNLFIFVGFFVVVIGLSFFIHFDKQIKDDGIDTGIVMEYCTILPNQYGLVFTHTDESLDKIKNAKLLKVTINNEESEVEEIEDESIFSEVSDFISKDVLYYANLSNSFKYENDLSIVVYMEITLEDGEKVTQKFTDSIIVEGYGGY